MLVTVNVTLPVPPASIGAYGADPASAVKPSGRSSVDGARLGPELLLRQVDPHLAGAAGGEGEHGGDGAGELRLVRDLRGPLLEVGDLREQLLLCRDVGHDLDDAVRVATAGLGAEPGGDALALTGGGVGGGGDGERLGHRPARRERSEVPGAPGGPALREIEGDRRPRQGPLRGRHRDADLEGLTGKDAEPVGVDPQPGAERHGPRDVDRRSAQGRVGLGRCVRPGLDEGDARVDLPHVVAAELRRVAGDVGEDRPAL